MKNKQQSVESVTVWPGRALLIDTQNPCDFSVMSRREISGDMPLRREIAISHLIKSGNIWGFEERKVFPSMGHVCQREYRGRGERI